MTNFNERIERLAELERKATPGPWTYDQSDYIYSGEEEDCDLIADFSCGMDRDKRLICALRNEVLPLLREMTQALSEAKAENVGLKGQFLDHAETDSYLRMVKYAAHVKDLYRWEKEQKEAVQAENERLEKAAYTALNSLVDFRCPEDEISELVSVIDARDILSVQMAIKALDEVLD